MKRLVLPAIQVGIVLICVIATLVFVTGVARSDRVTDADNAASVTVPTSTPAPIATIVPRPASGPLQVVYSGEDLTQGLYASSPDKTYTARLTADLSKAGAVSVTTIGKVGQNINYALTQPVPSGAGLVVVEYGTNESLRGGVPQFRTLYDSYLTRVRNANPEAELVCLGPWTLTTLNPSYGQIIKASCVNHGGDYLAISDLYGVASLAYLAKPGELNASAATADMIHANDSGHGAIYGRVLTLLDSQ